MGTTKDFPRGNSRRICIANACPLQVIQRAKEKGGDRDDLSVGVDLSEDPVVPFPSLHSPDEDTGGNYLCI